jgi:hypothetical protein
MALKANLLVIFLIHISLRVREKFSFIFVLQVNMMEPLDGEEGCVIIGISSSPFNQMGELVGKGLLNGVC